VRALAPRRLLHPPSRRGCLRIDRAGPDGLYALGWLSAPVPAKLALDRELAVAGGQHCPVVPERGRWPRGVEALAGDPPFVHPVQALGPQIRQVRVRAGATLVTVCKC
jgi:hypothetical protein